MRWALRCYAILLTKYSLTKLLAWFELQLAVCIDEKLATIFLYFLKLDVSNDPYLPHNSLSTPWTPRTPSRAVPLFSVCPLLPPLSFRSLSLSPKHQSKEFGSRADLLQVWPPHTRHQAGQQQFGRRTAAPGTWRFVAGSRRRMSCCTAAKDQGWSCRKEPAGLSQHDD